MLKYLACLALFCCANGLLFTKSPAWDGLKVKFGFPGIDGAYSNMPRTAYDARKKGFTLLDNQCTKEGASFKGQRYWYKNDPSVILLFDSQGTIAGIQTGAPTAKYTPTEPKIGNIFMQDDNRWTLTTYFVDPKTICAAGRSNGVIKTQGTGTNLYIQIGPNAETDIMEIPKKESDIKGTKWGHGKCFPGMGQHYWYNVTSDMDCDYEFPYCVLYTAGKLNAFCFAMDGDVSSPHKRYEHPSATQAAECCIDAPKCFKTSPRKKVKQSAMHVFFTEYPYTTNLCIEK